MRFEIVEAKAFHVGAIARRLRPCHAAAMRAIGVDPHRALRNAFNESSFCRTWLIDGHAAAIGGVSGPAAASFGCVWVALSHLATQFPRAALREARRNIAEMLETRHEVESAVLLADPVSWRFAQALGFFVKGAAEVSCRNRSLESILQEHPELMVSLPGGGAGVLVGLRNNG